MHRIATTPGGWNPNAEGVIFIEQSPGSIIFLTAADTDIQTLAACTSHLPSDFPSLRVANLLQLQQPLSIDDYGEKILSQARVIILRLLGGKSYWSYGLEVIKEIVAQTEAALFVLPGDDQPDPGLMSHSTLPLGTVDRLWHYLTEGGSENYSHALKFVADICFGYDYHPPLPKAVPRVGFYHWNQQHSFLDKIVDGSLIETNSLPSISYAKASQVELFEGQHGSKVGILFYRAHYLAGNVLVIDEICQALQARNLHPVPIFVSSLRDRDVQEELFSFFPLSCSDSIQLLLNTTSFSLAKIGAEDQIELWEKLDIPIFQVILSSSTEEQWKESFQGLTPRDVAMNVALPEVDGRIITRAVSFKSIKIWHERLKTDVVVYQPQRDRVDFVANLAANWIRLGQTPVSEKKIALILANYPNRDGRIANGVGLDTPASCIEILKALQQAGYQVEDIPSDGDELIKRLTAGITNDLEGRLLRPIHQSLSLDEYDQFFATLPEKVQQEIRNRWGSGTDIPYSPFIPISGIQLGNIFIGIQPSRGYDRDPSLNYHAPDLEPTHDYLAYYYWLREKFQALAIVHLGKHGNLEWLPGKSLALSNNCYPEIALDTIPNFYPFIVNDPGEGSQAKRRSHAVILDHLTPSLTRAELYGDLQKLETLIDEYYEAQNLDPTRLKLIGDRITQLIRRTQLNQDLGIESLEPSAIASFLTRADGYLCELKEAQIRDGLHIFGCCPQGRQLRDLIIAIARFPSFNRLGLTNAIAQHSGLEKERQRHEDTKKETGEDQLFQPSELRSQSSLEEYAAQLIDCLLSSTAFPIADFDGVLGQELIWIENTLLPALQKTSQEMTNLLQGLAGKYVPSGASGAPTRGRPEVLPTGRNFYSVDIRAIPTETAWDVGRKAAENLIERYTQEHGEYPKTLAISIWGTSTMRTGGDDVAQVLALLGVQPIWDGISRRVIDFEILSPSALGRPRVDVTVRVSGLFRDSFPNILQLLYNAINAVSSLKEDKEINPLAAQVQVESEFWEEQGLEKEAAKQRACYRIFGSKPGAYGAGLQGLIEAQNWQSDRDLARAYINWSSYAYDHAGIAHAMPEVFSQRLQNLEIVLHNQDNREHDLLDSDDYYQFQGGLTAAVRALTGKNPHTYFGDNSHPNNPKVRLLKEEIARVYRSRVVNPKWIAGAMRHGYKGAFEMSATVDYLFAYDATARCVEDFMYQGVAEAYLFDEQVQEFIQAKNPWAGRDIAERLLEAHQRKLWQSASQSTLDRLRDMVHQSEAVIEESLQSHQ